MNDYDMRGGNLAGTTQDRVQNDVYSAEYVQKSAYLGKVAAASNVARSQTMMEVFAGKLQMLISEFSHVAHRMEAMDERASGSPQQECGIDGLATKQASNIPNIGGMLEQLQSIAARQHKAMSQLEKIV